MYMIRDYYILPKRRFVNRDCVDCVVKYSIVYL